jgi:hypothetical protein
LLEWGSYVAECVFEAALQHDVPAADHGSDSEDSTGGGGSDELEVLGLAAVEKAGSEEDHRDSHGQAGVQDMMHAKAEECIGEPRSEAYEPDPCCLSHHAHAPERSCRQ